MFYIGYVLIIKGLKFDFYKVQVIIDFEIFKDVVGVYRFLGLVNYLVKFMNNLSVMCDLICFFIYKNVVWRWIYEYEEVFSKIKEVILQVFVLKYFDLKLEMMLQCDVLIIGFGVIFLQ